MTNRSEDLYEAVIKCTEAVSIVINGFELSHYNFEFKLVILALFDLI